jgi:mRNA interferase MazF
VAKFIRGEVVVVPFPFSDLTTAKRRPALVLAGLEGDDLILCQITSQAIKDQYAIPLQDHDFAQGALKQPSQVRPNRLFTADSHIVLYRVGSLQAAKLDELTNKLVKIIQGN